MPGGVGPLTIAMLMYNTVKAAKMRTGQSSGSGQELVDQPEKHFTSQHRVTEKCYELHSTRSLAM